MNTESLRVIFDAIEDPVFVHDMQFRVIFANRAYCRAAGMTEAEALGKPYWQVFPPGDGPLSACKDAMNGQNNGGYRDELSIGAKRYLSIGHIIPDPDGRDNVLYGLHILSDITERKQTEDQLQQQLKELSRWHDTTLGREMRILDLKREVNELLGQAGQPPRYPSAESQDPEK